MPSASTKPFHLVIDQADYLPQCRTILVERGRFATGRVRRRETPQCTELIVDGWEMSESMPSGHTLAPMMDWAVLTADDGPIQSPSELINLVNPRRSHLVVAISIDRENFDRFPVLIHCGGQSLVPEQIRYIGPGLLTLPETKHGAEAETPLRASRTRGALGSELHLRLEELSVAIIGAGRGGQELARHLVAIGVPRLTIIDGDTLQPENLDAMPASAVWDVGRPKAERLAASLLRNRPDLSISFLSLSVLSGGAMSSLNQRRYDTVFTFVDNDVARLAVSRVCAETKTVHVDMGTRIEHEPGSQRRIQSADIRLFQPGRGCVACVPKMEHLDDVLYELATPPDCLARGRRLEWHEQRAGSLLHVNAMAVSLGIDTWLAWLDGTITDSYWLRVRWPAGEVPNIQSSLVGPSQQCVFCRRSEH